MGADDNAIRRERKWQPSRNRSTLMVQMDFVPEGILERLRDAVGTPERRIRGDLESFKHMIEARASETGAWRGEVK